MAENPEQTGLRELSALRTFTGPPKEFWPRFLRGVLGATAGSKVVLLRQNPTSPAGWVTLAEYPSDLSPSRFLTAFQSQLVELAALSVPGDGAVLVPLEPAPARTGGHFTLGLRLKLYRSNEVSVLALLLSEISEAGARETLARLQLAADVPESYLMNQAVLQASSDVQKFAVALDLLAAVNTKKRFLAAAIELCNQLASTFRCERVSLGWMEGGYARLRAISQTERFDRKMGAVVALETVMDEALDQDEELLWPAPEGSTVVLREHAAFARDQDPGHLCSLPVRADDKPVAALVCERREAAFTPVEVQQLRLCADQVAPRLADLHRYDRWLGARLGAWAKDQAAMLVGPKHTWAKMLALLGVILVALLLLLRVPYRVEGNFVLKSETVAFRTAPFDGYIEKVFVRPGDVVKAGDPLVKLATRELELEELAAVGELSRYQREAERARSTNGLAEMRVALALADQASSRLELVRYRMREANIQAPFDGVIVEGDLRERLAAPVKQGEALVKLARVENLYVEAEIGERDAHDILNRQTGEIAFVSQPKLKFPIRIVKLEPAAFPRNEGNVFLVRCEFVNGVERWWRPGMSGLCKINVERRTLWWILTHRTTDFLRLKLWW